MNPFFDISTHTELPEGSLQLENLGSRRIWMSLGKRVRGDWGEGNRYERKHIYTDVTAEDYDRQFITKMLRIRPSYDIDRLIDHHFAYYLSNRRENENQFLKHMRYEIYPALKKRDTSGVYTELFDKWLQSKSVHSHDLQSGQTVNNNTINFGNIHAPIQFQQNSSNVVQTQHNHISQEQVREFIDLLRKDIEQVDENIRKDFAMEMNYAVKQLEKGQDAKPQLLSIGGLMKDAGINTFANVLAAPVFEFIKPYLGFQ